MRVTMKMTVVTMALGFVVGCTPGVGGDGGPAECTLSTDCPGLEQCHPTLNICVEDCAAEGAAQCPAFAPVCNEVDADGNYPLEEADATAPEGFRSICVCIEDGDCAAGEVCDTTIRECVDGGEPQDECTVATEAEDCDEGQICVDGQCVPDENGTCEFDDDCFGEGGLCDVDDQCYPAEEFTAYCSDAGEAPPQDGPPHIVIYDMEALEAIANGCGQDANLTLRPFLASVYSEAALAADDVYRANFATGNDRFFGHPADTDVEGIPGFPDEYFVTVYVCGNPSDDVAMYIDTGAAVSNAYCFDATP